MYTFPDSLIPLRNWLRSQGLTGDSIKTSRQAAFMAQQLLGSRIKFPPPGSDMTSTLLLIQKQLPGVVPKADLFGTQQARSKKATKSPHKAEKPIYLRSFDPDLVATGYHVFADGASIPNPGVGGWAFVAYRDGQEIYSDCGGEEDSTNNRMEITAVLQAVQWAKQYPTVKITIWSDSQYVVNGVNDWRHGWKAKGWQRGGPDAKPENRILLNAELWQELDAAIEDPRAGNISVCWVKGHAGHLWNERADELAEIGRQQLERNPLQLVDDLDAEYRAVMAG